MKYKALFIILLAAMLVTPVFAFIHPPPPDVPCATFAVKINDTWAWNISDPYKFIEPEDSFCTEFHVQVLALNVTDMYGFEYKLNWDPTYFNLIGIAIEQVWADQLIVYNKTDSTWHKLVAVAKAPSPGANDPNGGILLCTYTFHIFNDVCWPQGFDTGEFRITEHLMSDSCTTKIPLCTPVPAYWKFIAKHPEVYITPKEEINCIVGETVIYEVWVHNITKMKSLHFNLRWQGNHIKNCREDIWLKILNLTEVIINEDVFPKANRITGDIKIKQWPTIASNKTSQVTVDIEMKCDFPLINGTVKAVDLIFKKMDPWWCGRQPEYTLIPPHDMTPDNATTPLWFQWGYIDVMCPELEYIQFGEYPGDTPYLYYGKEVVTEAYNLYSPSDGPYSLTDPTDCIYANNPVTITVDEDCDEVVFKICTSDGFVADTWCDGDYIPDINDTAAFFFDIGGDGGGIKDFDAYDFQVMYEPGSLYYPSWSNEDPWGYATKYGGWHDKHWMLNESVADGVSAEVTATCLIVTVSIDKLGGACSDFAWWLRLHDHTGCYGSSCSCCVGMPDQLLIDWNGTAHLTGCKIFASYNEAKFTFMPVPGDLTGDGVVNVKDLTAIASKYCLTWSCDPDKPADIKKWVERYYYDFNKDGHIDILDIIVVSKNWAASCPF